MFRRNWCGLPRDVTFPANLPQLGYFINELDEVRSLNNPDNYFKYFINHNDRINQCQRFAFDQAIERIIHNRLERQGLQRLLLPLNAPISVPHVPIYVSPNLSSKKHTVVIIGQETQDLGILSCRVTAGPGGLEKGSVVSIVRELQGRDPNVGIILANVGQLYWWTEGGRALTLSAKNAVPMASLVHSGKKYVPALNDIPTQESRDKHVGYILEEILGKERREDGKITVIAVGGASCETMQRFLDDETNWAVWGERMSSMVLIEPICLECDFTNASFKEFLAKRCRCYTLCSEPVDTPIAPPTGNPNASAPPLGVPTYSSSESLHVECILIATLPSALSYLDYMAANPAAENTIIKIEENNNDASARHRGQQQDWPEMGEDDKPVMGKINAGWMEKEIAQLRLWEKFSKGEDATKEDADNVLEELRKE